MAKNKKKNGQSRPAEPVKELVKDAPAAEAAAAEKAEAKKDSGHHGEVSDGFKAVLGLFYDAYKKQESAVKIATEADKKAYFKNYVKGIKGDDPAEKNLPVSDGFKAVMGLFYQTYNAYTSDAADVAAEQYVSTPEDKKAYFDWYKNENGSTPAGDSLPVSEGYEAVRKLFYGAFGDAYAPASKAAPEAHGHAEEKKAEPEAEPAKKQAPAEKKEAPAPAPAHEEHEEHEEHEISDGFKAVLGLFYNAYEKQKTAGPGTPAPVFKLEKKEVPAVTESTAADKKAYFDWYKSEIGSTPAADSLPVSEGYEAVRKLFYGAFGDKYAPAAKAAAEAHGHAEEKKAPEAKAAPAPEKAPEAKAAPAPEKAPAPAAPSAPEKSSGIGGGKIAVGIIILLIIAYVIFKGMN